MGKQHQFGVTLPVSQGVALPLKFMVSPPSHVNRIFGPGLSAHREDSGYNTAKAPQVAAITMTSR